MTKTKLNIVLILILFSLAGCNSAKIKTLDDYQDVAIQDTKHFPTSGEIKTTAFKLVITKIDDSGIPLARNSGVGVTMATELSNYLKEGGSEILNNNQTIDNYNSVTAKNRIGEFNNQAHFVLTGIVGIANFSKSYSPSTTSKDKKGKVYVTPAYCSYGANIKANLKVLYPQTLRTKDSFELAGGSSKSTETGAQSLSRCPNLSQTEILSMVRLAGATAVKKSSLLLKDYFGPRGFVMERRKNGKKNIFKISLGVGNGLKNGMTAFVFRRTEKTNALTRETSVEKVKIAEAIVTDKITNAEAWIMVKDPVIANNIHRGDMIKVYQKRSLLDKLWYN